MTVAERMPEGWRSVPLKRAVSLNPEVIPENTSADCELDYVDISTVDGDSTGTMSPKRMTFGIAPSRARRVLRAGDTIVSTVRTYLKAVANFPEVHSNLVASTGFAVLRPNGTLLPRFAYWVAMSEPFVEAVVAHSEGVSYPAISPSTLGTLHVLVPPVNVQQRIANFLDEQTARIDALIAEKEALQRRIEELHQSELRWLIQGRDAEAEMQASSEPFVVQYPRYWRVERWKRLGRFVGGSGFPVEYQGDTTQELLFFKVRDLGLAKFLEPLVDAESTVSRGLASQLGATVLLPETIVFAKVGAALLLRKVRRLGREACIDNNMMGFVPDTRQIDPVFAQMALSLIPFDWLVNPGAVPSVSASQVGAMAVAIPSLDVQREIVRKAIARLSVLGRLQEHTSQHIERLREYRSSLISAAVTGQLDLGQAGERKVA